MKLTIEPTPTIVQFEGFRCRLWNGVSDSGIEGVRLFVHCLGVPAQAEQGAFERELESIPEPTAAISLRDIT